MNTNPITDSDDRGEWWRVSARVPLIKEPFVDWYRAESEAQALALWAEDAHRYGLPADAVTVARRATAEESAAFAACG